MSTQELIVKLRTLAGLMQAGEYADFAPILEEAASRLEQQGEHIEGQARGFTDTTELPSE